MTAALAWCAGGMAVAAAWVGRGRGPARLLLRSRVAPGSGAAPERGATRPAARGPALARPVVARGPALSRPAVAAGTAGALGTGAAIGAGAPWPRLLPVIAAVLVAGVLLRELRASRRAAAAAMERGRVRSFATVAAGELRAGRAGRDAVAAAARDVDGGRGWPSVVASTAEAGGDVAAALAEGAGQPGAEALREVAACWGVAEGSGAGLAASLDLVAGGLREREAHRREIAAELAGVRASGYLLAALPAFGLLLGGALGADPVHVLLGTAPGNVALAAGLVLDVAGVAWLGHLARRAEAGR